MRAALLLLHISFIKALLITTRLVHSKASRDIKRTMIKSESHEYIYFCMHFDNYIFQKQQVLILFALQFGEKQLLVIEIYFNLIVTFLSLQVQNEVLPQTPLDNFESIKKLLQPGRVIEGHRTLPL